MINPCAHDDHRASTRINRILGKFAGNLNYDTRLYRRNLLLPCRGVIRGLILISLCVKRTFCTCDAILAHHQIIDCGGITFCTVGKPYFAGRNHPSEGAVAGIIEVREHDFRPLFSVAFDGQGGFYFTAVFPLEDQIPFLSFLPALPHGTVRNHHLTSHLVKDYRFPV
ncbi:hypothetical protein D3C75_904050 [compost metagenome]